MEEKIIILKNASNQDVKKGLHAIFSPRNKMIFNVLREKYKSTEKIAKNLILACDRSNNIIDSVLLLPNPGNTSTMFFSDVQNLSHEKFAQMIQKCKEKAIENKCKLIQTTLFINETNKISYLKKTSFLLISSLLSLKLEVTNKTSLNTTNIDVREAKDIKNEQLLMLLKLTLNETKDFPELSKIRSTREIFETYSQICEENKNFWFIGLKENNPVGIVIGQENSDLKTIDIHYLGVIPSARRLGVASNLINMVLQKSIDQNINNIYLSCDSRNTPAKRLYRKHGFTIDSEKLVFLLPTNKDRYLELSTSYPDFLY